MSYFKASLSLTGWIIFIETFFTPILFLNGFNSFSHEYLAIVNLLPFFLLINVIALLAGIIGINDLHKVIYHSINSAS